MVKKLIIIISLFFLISCSSKIGDIACPEKKNIGSLEYNDSHNESYPKLIDGFLYFSNTYNDSRGTFEVAKSELLADSILPPIPVPEFNFDGLVLESTPEMFFNSEIDMYEVYFSATARFSRKTNFDLYYAYGKDGKFSNPVLINLDVNSDFNEIDPHVTDDKKYVYFASNRPGGIGGFDIYKSKRLNSGGLDIPKILGEGVNTPKSEKSPNISKDGNLYFSSNGYTTGENFDIIRAVKNGNSFEFDYILPYPYNTIDDEANFDMESDDIYISSNRANGCGKYDLYYFERCGKGKINIDIHSINSKFSAVGKLIISNDLYYQEIELYNENIELELDPGIYNINFSSKCFSDKVIDTQIEIPCDEQNTYTKNITFLIPEQEIKEFTFEEYNIPFFVGGYFMPNTTANLDDLKMKFIYNQMDGDTLRYIENPEEKYDDFAKEVDKALNEALSELNQKIKYLNQDCSKSNEVIKLIVTGFADPRTIDSRAKYNGPDIDDPVFDFSIKNGAKITNKHLSKLRAYFTAKYFETELKKNPLYDLVSYRFVWIIEGMGVDPRKDLTYDYNRRVKIEVKSELE